MKPKWLGVTGALCFLAGLIGSILLRAFNNSAIIAIGVRAVTSWTKVTSGAVGFGVGMITISLIPKLKQLIGQRHEAKLLTEQQKSARLIASSYESDPLNPEKTRSRFEQLQQNYNPNLQELATTCLQQMGSIDRLQAQLDRLIEANNATQLADVTAVFNSVERRMCINFRDISNCCLLIEDSESDKMNALSDELVKKALSKNDTELEDTSELLRLSVQYVNQYNSRGEEGRAELDAWLKTMQDRIQRG